MGNGTVALAADEVPYTEMLSQLKEKFTGMMHALHHEQGATLRIEILADKPVQDFINTHAAILDQALPPSADTPDASAKGTTVSDDMRQRLSRSNYIFSGIKTFHELNEAFPSLTDENGNRKPFERFLNDVQNIDKTYNQNYLRAEYNFVHTSADMAAKWEQFEADGDRYLLQYRTAKDDRVRPEHADLDGVTLPADDPFWAEFYPPNGWNCRCTVVQVRRGKYPVTPHDEAMSRGESALQLDKRGIFRFNPGLQQKTFPDYNPYTISQCRNCAVAKGNDPSGPLSLSRPSIPLTDLCQACQLLRQMGQRQSRPTEEERCKIRDAAYTWAERHLGTVQLTTGPAKRTIIVNNNTGDSLIVGKKFFMETYDKVKFKRNLAETMRLATEFGEWLPNAIQTGVEDGRHHSYQFKVFETLYQGVRIVCKVKDIEAGQIVYTMRVYR